MCMSPGTVLEDQAVASPEHSVVSFYVQPYDLLASGHRYAWTRMTPIGVDRA